MDSQTYLDTVVRAAHEKTMDGSLSWEVDDSRLRAQAHPLIRVVIRYKDKDGPDEARWEHVMVTHPDGDGATMAYHPESNMGSHAPSPMSRETFGRVEEIFRRVLLEPRRKVVETALKELLASVGKK